MKRTASLLASFFLLSVACGDSDSDGSGGDGGSGGSGPSTSATSSTKSSSTSTTSASSTNSSATSTKSSTTASTTGVGGEGGTGGGGTACIHDVCTQGDALDPACSDPCVATVCNDDGFCCDAMDGGWDTTCVGLAQRLCQADCGLINYGDLVITEIMNNPGAVTDANGEWIEIFNTTAAPIDLMGFTIYDDVPHTVTSSVVIAGGDYAVIGVNADMATNGGVVVDYEITDMSLNNAGDYLALEAPSLDIIDDLTYDSASGLNPNGASRSLDPMFIDADANDDDTNFCEATTVMTDGDMGTPGAANDPCP